jgi:hypothetical protein
MRVVCPHPDCNHVCDIVTKHHVRTFHQMEREDLFEKYGRPERVQYDNFRLKKNLTMKNERSYK